MTNSGDPDQLASSLNKSSLGAFWIDKNPKHSGGGNENWPYCVDVHVNLSLGQAHFSEGMFSHVVAQIIKSLKIILHFYILENRKLTSLIYISDTYFKGNWYFSGATTVSKFQGRQLCQNWFCLPSKKGFTLKGKNLPPPPPPPPGSKFFPLRAEPLFRKGLACLKANRKSQKLPPL